MPRESLDAAENLPKEAPDQGALGQLEQEAPRMPAQPPAGLERALLEAREGPALNGDRQDEPAWEIADVVGDDPEQQTDLIRPRVRPAGALADAFPRRFEYAELRPPVPPR
jgi:hypothetical protein